MYLIPILILFLVSIIIEYNTDKKYICTIVVTVIATIVTLIIVGVNISSQTMDTEIWSGKITKVEHKEEFDEWHEPTTETYTDSNGNIQTRIIDGYWEHHYAENYITTSDNGRMSVNGSIDGKVKFDDKYPNSNEELEQHYKVGTPTASEHTYENKVQASYSIYKNKDIDLEKFKDLPEYPSAKNYFEIDRMIGEVPNKTKALERLNFWNTELNKQIPDPEREGKTRSWKQVNLIFVNVGQDKPEEYGFALQDKWEGGNKNDFIISFSMDKQGNVNWVYPFSWSEVEGLKLEVRDYIMSQKQIKDFAPIVNDMNYMSMRKGIILYKPKTDFNVRYVVVDYDETNVYCIDLNSKNKTIRKVVKFSYDECEKNFKIE